MKRCHQVAAAIFLDECSEFNVTPSQHGCLHALHEFPGIDQIALGRLVGLDRSTAGLVIKALNQRKLIDRVVNRYDKRRMRLRLSADGEHLLRAMEAAAARARDRVFRGLPRESRAAFTNLLRAFLAGHDALINVDEVLAGSVNTTEMAELHARAESAVARPIQDRSAFAGTSPEKYLIDILKRRTLLCTLAVVLDIGTFTGAVFAAA